MLALDAGFAPLISQEDGLKITCADATAATQAQLVLEGHGIISGIVRTGPHDDDPTVLIVVNIAASSEAPAIRQDIERIPGVTIEDQQAA